MTHEGWVAQLDAYLDGELESGAMQELDGHLRECPACAAEILRRLQWKRTIRAVGQRYQAESSLRERVRKGVSSDRASRPSWRWTAVATMAAVLMVGVWGLVEREKRSAQQNAMVSELVDLHVATLASATPVDVVSSDRHTVKPWFEGKIPFSFNLPELQGSAYELAGGRVSYLWQSPGAELLYRVRKHQISVFIFQERPWGAGFGAGKYAEARSFQLESWRQGDLRYFAIGDARAEDIAGLRDLLSKAR